MEKRTERNKDVYKRVDDLIKIVDKKTDNTEFIDKTTPYQKIDPERFGNDTNNNKKEKKKLDKKTKLTIVFIAMVFVLLVAIGVVIYYVTK